MSKEIINRVNDHTYANDQYTLFRVEHGIWTLYKKGVKVDEDMFRWDVCDRNNLALVEV